MINLLSNKYKEYNILIVGVGGTGPHLISFLSQLIGNRKDKALFDITLIDKDHVEEKNLTTQKFLYEDITKNKAEVLSERYNAVYDLNIKYIEQYKFDDCIYKDKLIFDFYIPSLNTCIEYDGEGHYKPFRFNKDKETMQKKLEETQIRDAIKTQYCKDNNIKLIRIPYFEFDNIDEILKCLS